MKVKFKKMTSHSLKKIINLTSSFATVFVIFAALINFSCCSTDYIEQSTGAVSKRKNITMVCWNVQTFFDAETCGNEYTEFRKKTKWNGNAYLTRLKRLSEVMEKLNADIYVFEEIENEQVLTDISNQLCKNAWNPRKNLKHTFFAKEEGASIGCAVMSRFPISEMKIHSLDIRTENSRQPSLRPIVQVSVMAGGNKKLIFFINHWKSKSGGAEESEIWRKQQEKLLAGCILRVQEKLGKDTPCIICGDFNKDIREFNFLKHAHDSSAQAYAVQNAQTSSAQAPAAQANILLENVPVYSPWLDSSGNFTTETGSYYYKDEWERIDHIFTCGNAGISDFEVAAQAPWADEKKIPVSYKIYNGQGYSDHLPLKSTIWF